MRASRRSYRPPPKPDRPRDNVGPPAHKGKFTNEILVALDMDADELARKLAVSSYDVHELLNTPPGQTIAIDRDHVWTALANYVDRQIGALIGVREYLNRKLAADRKRRMVNRMRVTERG